MLYQQFDENIIDKEIDKYRNQVPEKLDSANNIGCSPYYIF
jgi:hypothetical protein